MGSLFDGIGGFPLAAVHCGVKPVWASEIETFPIEVTKERFPDMVHVGDITKLNGAELPPVDIICGGSPCQDSAPRINAFSISFLVVLILFTSDIFLYFKSGKLALFFD